MDLQVAKKKVFAYTGGNAHVAEDATAEAFTRALEHRSSIHDPLPWIYRTAFRFASAEAKRTSVTRSRTEASAFVTSSSLLELLDALRELSPAQRAAVVLHYEADLPIKEVARLMRTTVGAVKVHLFRGRRKLRDLLGEEAEDA